ncbi:6-pyruvoyl trahydropterin synthase family protein [Marinicrinis sediminis]|uniref:6-carboxy-5,6,7,8-tetrahydropterin synthase n=1 Tax=Marinicrinis sediminis TaxID=1652465 RepID=A0ABW5R5R7_9BACL
MIYQTYPSVPHSFVYELNKDFSFAAAHYIPREKAGVCSQLHGHTYVVNLTIAGDELDDCGFLVNFKTIKKLVHDRFDHTVLNEDEWFDHHESARLPSTEIVARMIGELVQDYLNTLPNGARCLQVFLRETPSSYVVYKPKQGDSR